MKKVALICGLAGRRCWVLNLNALLKNNYKSIILPEIITSTGNINRNMLDELCKYDLLILHSMSSYLLRYNEISQQNIVLFDPNIIADSSSLVFRVGTNTSEVYKRKFIQNILINSPCVCGKCHKINMQQDIEIYLRLVDEICEEGFTELTKRKILENNIPMLSSRDWQLHSEEFIIHENTKIDHMAMISYPMDFEESLIKMGAL